MTDLSGCGLMPERHTVRFENRRALCECQVSTFSRWRYRLWSWRSHRVDWGGGGTFDGIFLTEILVVLLAQHVPGKPMEPCTIAMRHGEIGFWGMAAAELSPGYPQPMLVWRFIGIFIVESRVADEEIDVNPAAQLRLDIFVRLFLSGLTARL